VTIGAQESGNSEVSEFGSAVLSIEQDVPRLDVEVKKRELTIVEPVDGPGDREQAPDDDLRRVVSLKPSNCRSAAHVLHLNQCLTDCVVNAGNPESKDFYDVRMARRLNQATCFNGRCIDGLEAPNPRRSDPLQSYVSSEAIISAEKHRSVAPLSEWRRRDLDAMKSKP
jgi:hypothetical protein